MNTCNVCHKADCSDDCEELSAIYRQQQKEKLADIDIDDMDRCMGCGCPTDEAYCWTCLNDDGYWED